MRVYIGDRSDGERRVWITGRELVLQELPGLPALSVVEDPPVVEPGSTSASDATASALVAACESAWESIQQHHPELPDVVMVLGTGVERGRLVKLGHWWGGRWLADGQTRGEVLLAGEALHLSPAQVFEVLLHEAAHGLNAARGIKDTSRGGRYHNKSFATTAREVLLTVRSMPPYGLASTSLSQKAAERYADPIAVLADTMRIARHLERGVAIGGEGAGPGTAQGDQGTGAEDDRRRSSSVAASCGCGRKLRMAPSVYAAGSVMCGRCGTEFSDGAEREAGAEPRPPERPDGEAVVDGSFLARRTAAVERETTRASRKEALNRERSNIEAALSTTRESGHEALTPLQERVERIRQLAETRRVAPATPSAVQVEGIAELVGTPTTVEDRTALGAWYERVGTPDEVPIPARDRDEVARRSLLARALLKADGTLSGPRVELNGTELMRGDRVVAIADVDEVGLPAGTLGTVERVDPTRPDVEIDFATWGRVRTGLEEVIGRYLGHDYVEAGAPEPGPTADQNERALDREASRLLPGLEL